MKRALNVVSVVYPSAVNIGCKSHAIDSVGAKFKTPTLFQFIIVYGLHCSPIAQRWRLFGRKELDMQWPAIRRLVGGEVGINAPGSCTV